MTNWSRMRIGFVTRQLKRKAGQLRNQTIPAHTRERPPEAGGGVQCFVVMGRQEHNLCESTAQAEFGPESGLGNNTTIINSVCLRPVVDSFRATLMRVGEQALSGLCFASL